MVFAMYSINCEQRTTNLQVRSQRTLEDQSAKICGNLTGKVHTTFLIFFPLYSEDEQDADPDLDALPKLTHLLEDLANKLANIGE